MVLISAPLGTLAKSQFSRPKGTGRMAFSAVLLSGVQAAVHVAHGPVPLVSVAVHGLS
jgi:hypothetical protein